MGVLVLLAALAAAALGVQLQRRYVERTALARHDLNLLVEAADHDLRSFEVSVERLTLEIMLNPNRRALERLAVAQDRCDLASGRLRACRAPVDVAEVTGLLEEGGYALAASAAELAGTAVPERRSPCFFNPGHGPAGTEISWAPPRADAAAVPACAMDARRLGAGGIPDLRMLRRGHRLVPWFQAGPLYAPYVEGYYGRAAPDGTFPAELIEAWSALEPEDEVPLRRRWKPGYESAPDPLANGG